MKYRITSETKEVGGVTLHCIECVTAFGSVKAGEKGGWIENEGNLSQDGNAWVCGNAVVSGDAVVSDSAVVSGDAWVSGNARVYGDAWVSGKALVCGNVRVSGNAKVYGNAEVSGNAVVSGEADYIVFKNWWSSGRYFTWTRSNDMWKVGCFFGTGEELVAKAYMDGEKSGREYERIVKYVNEIKKENDGN